jgi:hypothetical protein
VTVVTIGRPSGIAATASDTALDEFHYNDSVLTIVHVPPMVNISSQDRLCKTPMIQIIPMMPNDMKESF